MTHEQDQQQKRHRQSAEHIWHVWLNRWSDQAKSHDPSMYEFKSMVQFMEYGARQIENAYTGKLPVIHQQCSRSAPEKIDNNRLRCALGKDVTECDFLKSIKGTFDEQRKDAYYAEIPDAEIFRVMANTCAWHIYTTQIKEGKFIDTSEGWLMDESDRMYWERVYKSLAGGAPDPAEESEG